MKIEILGSGCSKCTQLYDNVRKALNGQEAEVIKVQDIPSIVKYGVMSTPGLVIDGAVVSQGKVLTPEQIAKLLRP